MALRQLLAADECGGWRIAEREHHGVGGNPRAPVQEFQRVDRAGGHAAGRHIQQVRPFPPGVGHPARHVRALDENDAQRA